MTLVLSSPIQLTRNDIVSDLHRVLSDLNKKTPDEISHLLYGLGIKGTPRSPQSCPVANYVRQECAWAETVIVAPSLVSAYPSKDCYQDSEFPTAIESKTFENVNRFIRNFDDGKCPDLLTAK